MRKAFTLIEVLTAVAIVALLVGLGVAAFSVGFEAAEQRRTQTLLNNLDLAWMEYTASTTYRVGYDGISNPPEDSIRYLVEKLKGAESSNRIMLMMDHDFTVDKLVTIIQDGKEVEVLQIDYFVDSWGTPLQYRWWHDGGPFTNDDGNPGSTISAPLSGAGDEFRYPMRGSEHHKQPFLASAGRDKAFGTQDDLYSFNIQ